MSINSEAFKLIGITEDEYIRYCRSKRIPYYKTAIKRAFFKKVYAGKIIRSKDGKLIENACPTLK